ncbi:MAG: bifunctional glutamate N-acetyltransferase/amino-acid acetyltransferase ArgJ [Candidatus Methylomirabilis sp.]
MKQSAIRDIPGGITAAKAVRASGVFCGIKRAKPDLALIVSDRPATVAGVTTVNRVKAAPVLLCERHLRFGRFSAVVVNSGNANACTGTQGARDAATMRDQLSRLLGRPPREIFVASTGVIGKRLPISKIVSGIREAFPLLSAKGGEAAARAIMTTDTSPKEAAVEFELGGKRVVIGGMAKGSGMIAPNLATTLCFVATDAQASASLLRRMLRRAVKDTFNAITVDGCMSTNDTLLLFANGASRAPQLRAADRSLAVFEEALHRVLSRLARMITKDGEGATKLIRVEVKGSATATDARMAAAAVANSPLVKTAFFGEDCNWGRIMAALGASGARFDPLHVDISLDGIAVVRGGVGLGEVKERRAETRMRRSEFTLTINLHAGEGESAVLTTDLTHEYVRINAGYRS